MVLQLFCALFTSIITSIDAFSRFGVTPSWSTISKSRRFCHSSDTSKPAAIDEKPNELITKDIGSKKNFRVKMHSFAIQGGRYEMEDEMVISKDERLAGVFDGHLNGDVSKYIKSHFENYFTKNLMYIKSACPNAMEISDVFNITAHQIDAEVMAIPEIRNAGSTFCSVYINRNDISPPADLKTVDKTVNPYQIISCNIGDSRAVLSRNGKAVELTKDHDPCDRDERRRIESVGAAERMLGIVSSHWRCLGSTWFEQ